MKKYFLPPKRKSVNWKLQELSRPFKIGDYYIDCGYIPRICVAAGEDLLGRSLIDQSLGFCSVEHCAPQRIGKSTAIRWAKSGPINKALRHDLELFYSGKWGNKRKIWWKK